MRLPMLKKFWLILLIMALPLILGGVASILMHAFSRSVPVLVFKVDVGTLIFMAGIFLTVLALAFYFGASIRDRLARTKLEDSLQEAERSRTRFLRRLDHEIKNPLTGLQAALANLRESESTQERERAARTADRAVERLARLLADLRKLVVVSGAAGRVGSS